MSVWRSRLATLRAMFWLALARVLVRFASLRRIGESLGGKTNATSIQTSQVADANTARRLATHVDRAALRLPGESKCLPKAIALQWMLRRARLPSRLVVAVHHRDREGPHAYHAWVEQGEHMLIGQCDRTDYRSVMVFEQAGDA